MAALGVNDNKMMKSRKAKDQIAATEENADQNEIQWKSNAFDSSIGGVRFVASFIALSLKIEP